MNLSYTLSSHLIVDLKSHIMKVQRKDATYNTVTFVDCANLNYVLIDVTLDSVLC